MMKHFFRKGLALLLACVFSLGLIQTLPAAARADGDASGSTDFAATFYVYASRSGYIKLTAQRGTAYVADYDYYGNFTGYKNESAYGFYHVQVVSSNYSKTYEWVPSATMNTNGADLNPSLIVVFPSYGDYRVTVTPMARQEIDNRYWPANRFQYWATRATWNITAKVNVSVSSSGGTQPQPQPQPQPSSAGQVMVNCYDGSGTFLSTYTETVSTSTTIYPRPLTGYTSTSSGKYITLNNGVCYPAAVNFYYQSNQVSASVTVYCYDTSGSYIRSYTENVNSSGTVYPRPITGYIVNSGGQYVTVTGAGASPATLTFYYRRNAVPAQLTVNCYDGSGAFIRSYTETITASRTVNPQAISGYNATSSGQYITYNANGTCSPASVNFYYQPVPQPGNVAISCYDEYNNLIKSYTESVTESRTINPPAIGGYTATSGGQAVTYSSGTVTPSAITFTYKLSGGQVDPGYYDDPKMVVPTQWDTQFKPGTATANGGSNADRINHLYKLYDNNVNTSFQWTYWNSEGSDNIPEFTIYFDHAKFNYIAIRNGVANNSSVYKQYGRVTEMMAKVYDNSGNVHTITFDLSDTCSDQYREYAMGRVCTDVSRVELFVTKIRNGTEHKYVLQMTDVVCVFHE